MYACLRSRPPVLLGSMPQPGLFHSAPGDALTLAQHPLTVGDAPLMPDLSLEAAEREQILRALQASGGKRVEAARRLGLSRRTLYRKLDRYGIA